MVRPKPSPQLVAIAAGCAAIGALLVGSIGGAARGCRASGRVNKLEERVARVEDILGIADAETMGESSIAAMYDAAAASADDHSAACAVAKVGAYVAWQDALSKAKVNAGPAEGACAEMWGDRKKQACYYTATAVIRTAQAARDAVIQGGTPARDAVHNVKDDPKNEAIPRAHAASEAAFAACQDDQ
jgi:hypothetical protein